MKARLLIAGLVLISPFAGGSEAEAHGGGLDGTGGHHCRQAGFDSGKCSPLNSYHCHQSPCGDPAPTTTAAPPPPPTTAATAPPTTAAIVVTTTTTAAPTTTTTTPSTTSTSESTTTTVVVPKTEPVSSDKDDESGPVDYALTFALLGGLGYGGYRLATRRARRTGGEAS